MAKPEKQTLTVIFDGDISPGSVRGRDLADVLDAVEDLIASIVVENEPDLNKDQIKISLVGIAQGSLKTSYSPNLQALTIPAIEQAGQAIGSGAMSELPTSSLESIKKIKAFTNKYECEANISLVNGDTRELAKITPETDIPSPISIKGETTLYGEITRVGGKEPRIQFTTIDGSTIYCETTQSLAKQAGKRIYTQVAIHGIAEWDHKTHQILSFSLQSISEYSHKDYSNVFQSLANAYGSQINKIRDANQFVRSLRSEDVEE